MRWTDPRLHNDNSNDLAVVKLARPPNHSIKGPKLADGTDLDGANIRLIAFHIDVPNSTIVRSGHGKIYPMPASEQGPYGSSRISSYQRMFVTDVDSNHGASGGMYVNDEGNAIGINVGFMSIGGAEQGEFSVTDKTYNFGVYIDRTFFDEMMSVAGGTKTC